MIKKPMLAAKNPILSDLKYPLALQPKLDGIRCLVINGKAVSRTLKPIPNDYVRTYIEQHAPEGSDGEIVLVKGEFNDIQSSIMSKDGEPEFEYIIFDIVTNSVESTYGTRLFDLLYVKETDKIKILISFPVNNPEEVVEQHKRLVGLGFEGSILRSYDGIYKEGRSTLKEGFLIALKDFDDGEAEVVGFIEMVDKDGNPKNTLGAFIVKNVVDGVEFNIGTGKGLNQEIRKHIWENQDLYLGQLLHYRFQSKGTKNAPRIPVWHGFRNKEDI